MRLRAAYVKFTGKERSRLAHIVHGEDKSMRTLCGLVPTKEFPLTDQAAWTDGGQYCGRCLASVDALPHSQQGVLGLLARQERRAKLGNKK